MVQTDELRAIPYDPIKKKKKISLKNNHFNILMFSE